jgi:GTPase SAR1 family protein
MYFRGSRVILLLFDLSSRYSFETVRHRWGPEARRHILANGTAAEAAVALIGTKSDLIGSTVGEQMRREVSHEEGESLAKEMQALFFMECSSRTGENVSEAIMRLVTVALEREEKLKSGIEPPEPTPCPPPYSSRGYCNLS